MLKGRQIIGNIVDADGEKGVHEFRAQRPDFGEVYSIAAVNIGWDILLSVGCAPRIGVQKTNIGSRPFL